MIAEFAELLWPLAAFAAIFVIYRRTGDVLADRAAVRSQRTDDVEALRKDLVAVKSKVNAMALKQGFARDD